MDKLIEKYLESTYKTAKILKDTPKSRIVLATDTVGSRPCIIKYLSGSISIYHELEKLKHKNIPQIYRVIENGTQIIIIEEYINGFTLADLLMNKQQLSDRQIKSILQQLCSVLLFLHSHKLIHRDIKPSNIMLTDEGTVKLIDFDAARIIKDDSSPDTEYLGTRGYAPPEQYGFSQTDVRSDIYALGVTLKAMEPKASKLRRIADKAARFDPERRYQSIQEIEHDMHRLTLKQKAVIATAMFIALGTASLFGYSFYLNATNQPNRIEQIKDDVQDDIEKLPRELKEIDSNKLKESIKNLTPEKKVSPIHRDEKQQTSPSNIQDAAPGAESGQVEKSQKQLQQEYERDMAELDDVKIGFSYDGTDSSILKEYPKIAGSEQTAKGVMKLNITNSSGTDMSGGFSLIFEGMFVPNEAMSYSSNISAQFGDNNVLSFQNGLRSGDTAVIQIDMNQVYPFNDDYAKLSVVRISNDYGNGSTVFSRSFSWQIE